MRKPISRLRTTFAFAQRADLFVTAHTADILVELLQRKEALRRLWNTKSFRDELAVYGAVGATTFATGALVSLVTAIWIK